MLSRPPGNSFEGLGGKPSTVEPLLRHGAQVASPLHSGTLRSRPAAGRRITHEFRQPGHARHVGLVRKPGNRGNASFAVDHAYDHDSLSDTWGHSRSEICYPNTDSRLGCNILGSSGRPGRSIPDWVFHAGFFHHDEPEPTGLPADTGLFV